MIRNIKRPWKAAFSYVTWEFSALLDSKPNPIVNYLKNQSKIHRCTYSNYIYMSLKYEKEVVSNKDSFWPALGTVSLMCEADWGRLPPSGGGFGGNGTGLPCRGGRRVLCAAQRPEPGLVPSVIFENGQSQPHLAREETGQKWQPGFRPWTFWLLHHKMMRWVLLSQRPSPHQVLSLIPLREN